MTPAPEQRLGGFKQVKAMKLFRAIVIGFCLFVYFFFGNPNPATAIATNLYVSNGDFMSESSTKTAIDNFLTSIPQGYYTIKGVNALKEKMEGQSLTLIDVRETSEYESGHIEGAINIPLRELVQNLDRIPTEQPVILYCATGYRTAMGVMALQMLGYHNVEGFPPSIQGWKQAGEPISIALNK
jgi:rhodanese-related sulfurtransferase